jgi:C_GCAxxG_C_C family probable redox protein
MQERIEEAARKFLSGYTCSQAVFGTYGPLAGIPADEALRIATAFGAGIARQQEVCGAVTGACMAISAKHGTTDPSQSEAKTRTYALVEEFMRKFREEHGSYICLDLLGVDLQTEAGHKEMGERNLRDSVCLPCVKHACSLLEDILAPEAPPKP